MYSSNNINLQFSNHPEENTAWSYNCENGPNGQPLYNFS
jgi:hypothetical protein